MKKIVWLSFLSPDLQTKPQDTLSLPPGVATPSKPFVGTQPFYGLTATPHIQDKRHKDLFPPISDLLQLLS